MGSVQIDGGAGDDTIKVGHIEGGTGGLGYIDGGDGNDLIQVLDTWNGIGIWGNAVFQLRGGAGDDRFVLAGTQLDTKSCLCRPTGWRRRLRHAGLERQAIT